MKIRSGHLLLAGCAVFASASARTTAGGPAQTARRERQAAAPAARAQNAAAPPPANPVAPSKAFVDSYCATCHNQRLNKGGLALDPPDVTNVAANALTLG